MYYTLQKVKIFDIIFMLRNRKQNTNIDPEYLQYGFTIMVSCHRVMVLRGTRPLLAGQVELQVGLQVDLQAALQVLVNHLCKI